MWGDPTPTDRLWCSDGEYLEVNASAASALRSRVAANAPGYIWIDALRINQRDNDEKARQIRLMWDIYRSAERVLAWLGSPAEDRDLALAFLPILLNAWLQLRASHTPVNRKTIGALSLCESPSKKLKALGALLERPCVQKSINHSRELK
jgi:hypothetical protein